MTTGWHLSWKPTVFAVNRNYISGRSLRTKKHLLWITRPSFLLFVFPSFTCYQQLTVCRIFVKFGIGFLHKNLSCKPEYCESHLRVMHSLSKGLNEYLSISSFYLVRPLHNFKWKQRKTNGFGLFVPRPSSGSLPGLWYDKHWHTL